MRFLPLTCKLFFFCKFWISSGHKFSVYNTSQNFYFLKSVPSPFLKIVSYYLLWVETYIMFQNICTVLQYQTRELEIIHSLIKKTFNSTFSCFVTIMSTKVNNIDSLFLNVCRYWWMSRKRLQSKQCMCCSWQILRMRVQHKWCIMHRKT